MTLTMDCAQERSPLPIARKANQMANVISIMCPNLTCRAVLRVPQNARGKKVRCAQCGTTLTIPKPGSAPPPDHLANIPARPPK